MFNIADVPFSLVPEDEKKRFAGDIKKTGSYRGYKLRQYWVRRQSLIGFNRVPTMTSKHIDNGVRDQLEHYNSASP